jgi:hypothetical protein
MIALRSAELVQLPLHTRMPFRYGIATLTELPHAVLRLTFEIDGAGQAGVSADSLPPKWFTKDPARALDDEVAEMRRVLRAAVSHARGIEAATPFAFWRELYAVQDAWAVHERLPPLLAHFGTSFVERALIDAFCRAKQTTFAAALRANALGLELGAIHATLAGQSPRDGLPATPAAEVFARHTVGLSDPIETEEIPAAERLADGLPQSLVDCTRFYGLRHFKIKINGEAARDRDRLAAMAKIFEAECGGDFAFSLDGNESWRDAGAFPAYARELFALPGLRTLWPRLLFVEQPWHREVALSPAVGDALRTWPERPPIIIDESDAEIGSLAAALALGYAGTSHKNCKGVFKSVANACLLAPRRSTSLTAGPARGQPAILSGEDLVNVGPVALTQDLAVQAALGVTSVERNGHHYFAGLSEFPPAWQAHALAHHGDLFTGRDFPWPRLDVRAGRLALGSVNTAAFGSAGELDFSVLPAEFLA